MSNEMSSSASPFLTSPSTEVTADAAGPSTTIPTSLVFLNPPPTSANIPSPPPGFVPPMGGEHVGARPRLLELAALPLAVGDLMKFTDYQETMGRGAPQFSHVLQAFAVGNQWSTMRAMTDAWDAYCNSQEGIAWKSIRTLMERLLPAFDLAVQGDPTLLTRFPNLAAFLGAKKAIAAKGAATRRMNQQAIAEGKMPVHGSIGKRRKRAAEKAALASATVSPTPASLEPAAAIPSNEANGVAR